MAGHITGNKKKNGYSFEVFPPKKEEEFPRAYEVLNALKSLEPDFISVTYGAGGSRSKSTVELASYIQNTLHINALAHLTCVGCRNDALLAVCKQLKENHINHILALRGDRPKDMTDAQFAARDFEYASEMIRYIKEHMDFTIAAACYPEGHFESPSLEADLDHLKEKQKAGASFLITQMFFDNALFYHFLEKLTKKGIELPVHAGIMPITSAKQLGTTVSLSGASIPPALSQLIATYGDNPQDMYQAGVDYAIRQIADLRKNGIADIHIYTMNKPELAAEIIKNVN
ncbi:MAG: methylenetetrahydrofolate reductase [NAD(P)H] [Lachnospiraceae bacterium]|nr:methylenetetrahydrofolate reductase [NAD(P)H] [Lachnospiraceae bacterium]